MSTENKGWMERVKETAKGAMTEAGRRMNDVAERGKSTASDKWNETYEKVAGREKARQEEGSKLSLGERIKLGITSSAERAKNTVDNIEKALTKATEAAERFSGSVATAKEIVSEGVVSGARSVAETATSGARAVSEAAKTAARVTTETGKRAVESLKNTPTWAWEGIKSAASRAEAARVAAAERMKSKIDTTIERGKALGVRIVEDVKGRIREVKESISHQKDLKVFESLVKSESLDRAAIENIRSQLAQLEKASKERSERIATLAGNFRAQELSARTLEILAYSSIAEAPEKDEE